MENPIDRIGFESPETRSLSLQTSSFDGVRCYGCDVGSQEGRSEYVYDFVQVDTMKYFGHVSNDRWGSW